MTGEVAAIDGRPKEWERAAAIQVAPGARVILALELPEGWSEEMATACGTMMRGLCETLEAPGTRVAAVLLPHGAKLHVYEGQALCGHDECLTVPGMASDCAAAKVAG